MQGLHIGDAREFAAQLPAQSVQTIVTSPPYYSLRAYLPSDHPDKGREMGAEATVEEYVANLVALFAALRHALRDDGTLWLNLGDSYGGIRGNITPAPDNKHPHAAADTPGDGKQGTTRKQLLGIPWRVAFALQADGWYLRQDIIWSKPNPMPESVRDRCTKAHEYLFLLSKSDRYYYDADAIAEPLTRPEEALRATPARFGGANKYVGAKEQSRLHSGNEYLGTATGTRNKRSVWTVSPAPFPGSHYATMPPELVRPCILAGSSAYGACAQCLAPWRRVVERGGMTGRRSSPGQPAHLTEQGYIREGKSRCGDVEYTATIGWQPSCQCGTAETVPCLVLDPFLGSGTVAAVAIEEGRRWVGCDLDARNAALVTGRIDGRQVRFALTAD